MSRFSKLFTFVAIAAAACLWYSPAAAAVTAADWQAGDIINDSVFYTKSRLSVEDIQYHLNAKVPVCDTWGTQPHAGTTRAQYGTSRGYPPPFTCLKDYSMDTQSKPGDAYCLPISAGHRSSAQIIYDISNACTVDSKALIVMLEKEQGLVTDDWPWSIQYRSAMGYGCPDTAPCDAEFYGFFNQVYNAAWQFKSYAANPTSFRYKPFQNNFIYWSPRLDECGGTDVFVSNRATAGLYNYTPYQPNSAALNNLYGQGDGCSAYGNRNFWRLYNDWFGSTQREETLISFKSYLNGTGWTGLKINQGITGTTGQSRALEAFKINNHVRYSSYNTATGWQPTVSQGMISGTTEMNRALQAIRINPAGTLAESYDIYYRVHVSGIGWMGWTKNGQPAGVTGDSSRRIEAIDIQTLPKSFAAPGTTRDSYRNISSTSYSPAIALGVTSHVSGVGWQAMVTDTMVSGTTEQSRQIEAIKINLTNTTSYSGTVVYAAHLAGIGWQDLKTNNDMAGTTGQSRQMEAIRIALTGQLGDNYNIWYRGYIEGKGWMGWTKNGYPSGSVGAGLRLEAVESRILPKTSPLSPTAGNSIYNPKNKSLPLTYELAYAAHVGSIGWMDSVPANSISGTTGQSKRLEAIRVTPWSSILGTAGLACSGYVQGVGWTSNVSTGETCGSSGQSKPLEAIKLAITGETATKYNILYKVHVSGIGWQDWVSNGAVAGTEDSGRQIEAIIINVTEK